MRLEELFRKFAAKASKILGSPWAFTSALAIIVLWLFTGPFFRFSNTWQLIINTGTTIITFLMVFLIQNTQNRDSAAAQIKLDEVIRALSGARSELIDLEDLSEEQITHLQTQFADIGQQERSKETQQDA